MIVTPDSLDGLFKGYNTSFNKGFDGAETQWNKFAMLAPSSTRDTTYAWLGQVPRLREWLGERVIKSVSAYGYRIENRKFEDTIDVERTDIEDDQFGIYGPLFTDMGRATREFPDELSFALLAAGLETPCYDGQNFFDTEHPSTDLTGQDITISNYQDGAYPTWYLFDTSRAIKPLIFQERTKPELTRLDQPNQPNVFFQDKYIYGTRYRCAVGFGLWQLAYAGRSPLDAENYAVARMAMQTLRGDAGRLLGVKPTLLMAPPELEKDARILLNSATIDATTNPWAGSAELVISPWLAG